MYSSEDVSIQCKMFDIRQLDEWRQNDVTSQILNLKHDHNIAGLIKTLILLVFVKCYIFIKGFKTVEQPSYLRGSWLITQFNFEWNARSISNIFSRTT